MKHYEQLSKIYLKLNTILTYIHSYICSLLPSLWQVQRHRLLDFFHNLATVLSSRKHIYIILRLKFK